MNKKAKRKTRKKAKSNISEQRLNELEELKNKVSAYEEKISKIKKENLKQFHVS